MSLWIGLIFIYTFIINRKNILITSLETCRAQKKKKKQLKSCGFLTDSFEKCFTWQNYKPENIMALTYCKALLLIRKTHGCGLFLHSLREFLHFSCTSRLLTTYSVPIHVCGPQFCPIWTGTDLPLLSVLGKVFAPSCGLILLGKVLVKEDAFFVMPYFELIFLLEVSKIILLATFYSNIHVSR